MNSSLIQFLVEAGKAASFWRRRTLTATAVAITLSACALPLRSLAAANSMEYQVKAGFLFNFAKFVEWPDGIQNGRSELRLGIAAPDEIFELMAQALEGKVVGERPVRVVRITAADVEREIPLPQIVFVQQDAQRPRQDSGVNLPQLFALAEKQSVLVVGESAGFANAGGIIGFVQRGENLRFQVNLAKAQRAGLKLSARLSGLAEIVATSP